MIKAILDRVLANRPPTTVGVPDPTADMNSISLDAMPTFGVEFETFFENIDWNAFEWPT